MRMTHRLTTLSLLLAAALPGVAQETTATLVGTIVDRTSGKPLQGVTLKISAPTLLGARVVVTKEDGSFRVPMLPNGDYTMQASKGGFLGSTATFKLIAGLTYRQDMKLRAEESTAAASVEVVSTAAQVDKTETSTASAYTVETLNQIYSGNLNAALNFSPGQVDKNNGGLQFSSMRGGNSGSTKFLVNGVTANEQKWGYSQAGLTVVQDLVESFNVIQSPLNAKYGNTDGGVVSMVTTRGTNEFKGSVRVDMNRGGATTTAGLRSALEGRQLNRLGELTGSDPNPSGDSLGRNFEIALSGPIIKDRLTFAYGGKLKPTEYYRDQTDQLVSTPTPNTDDAAGIFFRDPAKGVDIRKAYLGDQGKYYPNAYSEKFNQYVLFFQINPEHTVEYNFTEWTSGSKWRTGIEIDATTGMEKEASRFWNVGYKGVIGSAGLLEARVGKISRSWSHPYAPNVNPIQLGWYGTAFPDEAGDYYANSVLQSVDNGSSHYDWTVGSPYDKGDTIINHTMQINYQHLLQWHGSHQLDMGFERQKYEYESQAGGHASAFVVPGGRIDPNLSSADIILNGWAGAVNPADYAGKYIMWGYNTPLNLIDPGYAATPIYQTIYGGAPGAKANLIPRVTLRQGPDSSILTQPTDSLWFNDLYTYNDHWSFMAGLRYDRFKLSDARGEQHSYSKLSPRLEVKWDIKGDQSRMVNASYAQFHNRPPSGLFDSFLLSRRGYRTTLLYTGAATPHLADAATVTNPDNYKYVYSYTAPGVNVIDKGWKADSSHELSVGYRRAYTNGGYLRATFIYRWWADLFDLFPEFKGTTFTNPYQSGAQVTTFRRVLRNDGNAKRTYKSLELEWMAPLSKRLQFMGNYTYARNVGNVAGIQNNPYSDGMSVNFLPYLTSRYPLSGSQLRPEGPIDFDHTLRGVFIYDLTVGRVKSSASFRVSYSSGAHFTTSTSYGLPGIPTDLMPGYTDKGLTSGIPTSFSTPWGGKGAFIGGDSIGTALKYNLEIPIARKLAWWMGLEITNPFNHILTRDAHWGFDDNGNPIYGPKAFGSVDAAFNPAKPPVYGAYGYRMAASLQNSGIQSRYGLRSWNLETGIRF